MKILQGHNNFDNALVINNYPYGFRLRTKIKYWIESNKKGDRFISCTLNPKTNKWNKPKKSTYSSVEYLYQDEIGHIHSKAILKGYSTNEKIDAFLNDAGQDYIFNEYQLKAIKVCKAINNTQKYFKVEMVNTTNYNQDELKDFHNKQNDAKKHISKAFIHELNKL